MKKPSKQVNYFEGDNMARKSEHIYNRTIFKNNHYHISTLTDALFNRLVRIISSMPNSIDELQRQNEQFLSIQKECECFIDKYNNTFNLNSPRKNPRDPDILSIIDIETILSKILHFNITSQKEIQNKGFNINNINKQYNITTFKDNLSNKRSDNIIIFNLALLWVANSISENNVPILCRDYENELSKITNSCSDLNQKLDMCISTLNQILSNSYNLHIFCDDFLLTCIAYQKCNVDYLIASLNKIYRFIEKEKSNLKDNEDELKKYKKTYSDVYKMCTQYSHELKNLSSQLFNIYKKELPNYLEMWNQDDFNNEIIDLNNTISETACTIKEIISQSNQNYDYFYARFLHLLENITPENNVKDVCNIIDFFASSGKRFATLAKKLFFSEYTCTSAQLMSSNDKDLELILNKTPLSLAAAEDIADLLSSLSLEENDWNLLYSLLSAQINNRKWYLSFHDIVNICKEYAN